MKTFVSKVQKKHENDSVFSSVVVLNLGPGSRVLDAAVLSAPRAWQSH